MIKVSTKDELKSAIKEREGTIRIEGKYADEVVRKYSIALNSKPLPLTLAMLTLPRLGLSAALEWYSIDKYVKNNYLVIKMDKCLLR
jgi:hypothetical protein